MTDSKLDFIVRSQNTAMESQMHIAPNERFIKIDKPAIMFKCFGGRTDPTYRSFSRTFCIGLSPDQKEEFERLGFKGISLYPSENSEPDAEERIWVLKVTVNDNPDKHSLPQIHVVETFNDEKAQNEWPVERWPELDSRPFIDCAVVIERSVNRNTGRASAYLSSMKVELAETNPFANDFD